MDWTWSNVSLGGRTERLLMNCPDSVQFGRNMDLRTLYVDARNEFYADADGHSLPPDTGNGYGAELGRGSWGGIRLSPSNWLIGEDQRANVGGQCGESVLQSSVNLSTPVHLNQSVDSSTYLDSVPRRLSEVRYHLLWNIDRAVMEPKRSSNPHFSSRVQLMLFDSTLKIFMQS